MTKILVPVDGSENADKAVQHVLSRPDLGSVDIHLLSVQIPVDSGHARMFVSHEDLQNYYRAEGMAALTRARQLVEQAGVRHEHHILVGHVADTICRFAEEGHFDEIVMGSHGRTGLLSLLMGSVASAVSKQAKIKVTLI